MKIVCVGIIVCFVVLSCTRDWNNPYDSKGTAEPDAPAGLKAVALNDSTIELTWQDSQGEIGYRIERGIDGGPLQEIGSVSQNGTRFVDEGLRTDDHQYYYRVTAFAANGKEAYTNSLGGMIRIPAGSFQMGDAFNEGGSNEWPVHTVYVDAFYIDISEVTNAQYQAYDSSHNSGSYSGYSLNGDDQPVVRVSWWHAIKYCNWRSRQKGLEECYDEDTGTCDFSKNGYRLPTEAEWEYAARGGLERKRYPWGNEAPVCQDGASNGARFDDNDKCNDIGTAPVGSYSPNGYGLYNMAGNVWEWCSDWYDSGYYSTSPENNPTGAGTGSYRVLRGGAWANNPSNMRCAERRYLNPPYRNNAIGFRCVRSSP